MRSLRILDIHSSILRDITALKCLRLREFRSRYSPLKDITALADMPLELIDVSQAAIDPNVLRQIKTLGTINRVPAAEFWQAYAKEQTAGLAKFSRKPRKCKQWTRWLGLVFRRENMAHPPSPDR